MPTSPQYRPYLPSRYHQQFDEWALAYPVLHEDLLGEEGRCNWDSDRRLADLEADGIVAEVIYPNTIPPFYPEHSLKVQMPGATEGDLEARWAGLRAHNRWFGRFLRRGPRAPGRASPRSCCTTWTPRWPRSSGRPRRRWAAGILLPGTPPGSGLEPMYSAR